MSKLSKKLKEYQYADPSSLCNNAWRHVIEEAERLEQEVLNLRAERDRYSDKWMDMVNQRDQQSGGYR